MPLNGRGGAVASGAAAIVFPPPFGPRRRVCAGGARPRKPVCQKRQWLSPFKGTLSILLYRHAKLLLRGLLHMKSAHAGLAVLAIGLLTSCAVNHVAVDPGGMTGAAHISLTP